MKSPAPALCRSGHASPRGPLDVCIEYLGFLGGEPDDKYLDTRDELIAGYGRADLPYGHLIRLKAPADLFQSRHDLRRENLCVPLAKPTIWTLPNYEKALVVVVHNEYADAVEPVSEAL